MYRFLISRRWAIMTLLALALMPTMIKLGFWQLHRHESRVARNTLIADNLHAKPEPIGSLTKPGYSIPAGLVWRAVSATGHYDSAHEFVVRQRTGTIIQSDDTGEDGGASAIGYFVITPLVTAGGDEVLVNRGWVASGQNATTYPKIPPAPTGQVTVRGRLRADETTASSGIRQRGGLPARQYMLINSEQQRPRLNAPLLGGYIELVSTTPRPTKQPQLVAEPDHSSIGPHLAYAIQWWLFTAMVPVGWIVLARREATELAEEREKEAARAAGPDPEPKPSDEPEPAGNKEPAGNEPAGNERTSAADAESSPVPAGTRRAAHGD